MGLATPHPVGHFARGCGAETDTPATVYAGNTPDLEASFADPSSLQREIAGGWGYSPLDQIDRDNVGQIRMVWSRGLAEGRQEGTPLAYRDVRYMPQSNDVIEAIDTVTGDLIWQHRRDLPDDVHEYVGGNARSNRNISIYDRFIVNTSDEDYIFGIDARPARSPGRRRYSTTR